MNASTMNPRRSSTQPMISAAIPTTYRVIAINSCVNLPKKFLKSFMIKIWRFEIFTSFQKNGITRSGEMA